jgi:hypothetical protein
MGNSSCPANRFFGVALGGNLQGIAEGEARSTKHEIRNEEKTMSAKKKTTVETGEERRSQTAATVIRVRAVMPLYEGRFYGTGEEFETTPERAAALGPLVDILTD